MRRKIRASIFIAITALVLILGSGLAISVFAQDASVQFAREAGFGTTELTLIVAKIIRAVLGLLGIIFVCIILYGGFVWMTAGDSEEKLTKAKQILKNGVIGVVIILSAFTITQFIIGRLGAIIRGEEEAGLAPAVDYRLSGSLGGGIIESHYPWRDQKNVARNTKIIVTFKEPMEPKSFIEDTNNNKTFGDEGDKIKVDAIKIRKSADPDATDSYLKDIWAVWVEDQRTVVLEPQDHLGSDQEKINYTAHLTSRIKKAGNLFAFAEIYKDGYKWNFETGTTIDLIPPKVSTFFPLPDPDPDKEQPRNVVVQVTFDEAINPITIDEMEVWQGENKVDGKKVLSNLYRTVEFLPTGSCNGATLNSCGQPVFCLPASSTLKVIIPAAALSNLGNPQASIPYSGIVDLAGNSLNGNGELGKDFKSINCQGKAVADADHEDCAIGPDKDNFFWSFATNDTVKLTPPEIAEVLPKVGAEKVALNAAVEILFNSPMMNSTLISANIPFESTAPAEQQPWYYLDNQNTETGTKTFIKHGDFVPSDPAKGLSYFYYPTVKSDVKDSYQNCFYPGMGPNCDATNPTAAPYCCNGEWCHKPCEKGLCPK